MNQFPDELLNAKVVFGLQAQGHIPTIERMLSLGSSWVEIGNEIHWCPITAREHYERFKQEEDKKAAYSLLAKSVELLRKFQPDLPTWDSNTISEFIFRAEKHLLSTPAKVNKS